MNPKQQAEWLFNFWHDKPFSLRVVCEVGVGEWSLLSEFRHLADRTVLVEPNPGMAKSSRKNFPWAEIHEIAIGNDLSVRHLRLVGEHSFVTNTWSPVLSERPRWARKHAVRNVPVVTFDKIDTGGNIDVMNVSCCGSEMRVLERLKSVPRILCVETHPGNPELPAILGWFSGKGYEKVGGYENKSVFRLDEQAT